MCVCVCVREHGYLFDRRHAYDCEGRRQVAPYVHGIKF